MGAIAENGTTYERDINLKIANYLKKELEKYQDVNIILTHNGNITEKFEIYDRAMLARKNKADLLVSLHINSAESKDVAGAEVYVTANTSLPKYNAEMSKLGNMVLSELEKLGIKNWKEGVATRLIPNDTTDVYSDGTRADYYGIIRYAMRGCKIDYGIITPEGAVPANVQNGEGLQAILIEHCYIVGTDFQYVDSDEDIQKLAIADANAIVKYYGLKEKKEEVEPVYNFRLEEVILMVEPTTTMEDIKAKYPDAKLVTEGVLITGNKITIKEKEYTIIQLGDVNQDGKVSAGDYVQIKNKIMNGTELDNNKMKAADINKDNQISAGDYVLIKNYKTNEIK